MSMFSIFDDTEKNLFKALVRFMPSVNDEHVWMSLSSREWITLLTHRRGFNERCESNEKMIEQKCDEVAGWRKIGSRDLVTLLTFDFKFIDKPFDPLAWKNIFKYATRIADDDIGLKDVPKGWLRLLAQHPELTTYFSKYDSWASCEGNDWVALLSAQPRCVEYCDNHNAWSKITTHGWACLLNKRPEFASYCDKCKGWSAFTIEDWSFLLSNQPQFIDRCGLCSAWSNLTMSQWVSMLKEQPCLAKTTEAEKRWKEFSGMDWIELLRKDPVWEAECQNRGGWDIIAGCNGWFELLKIGPQFVNQCERHKGWSKLSIAQWVSLLKEQLYLSEKCDAESRWKDFSGFDWVELLREQPILASKCQEWGGWRKISTCECWCELLEVCPQFAWKCTEYGGWNSFDGFDWWRLLKSQTFFIEKCNQSNSWLAIYSCALSYDYSRKYSKDSKRPNLVQSNRVFNRGIHACSWSALLNIFQDMEKDAHLFKRVNTSFWIYAIKTRYYGIGPKFGSDRERLWDPCRSAESFFRSLSVWGIWQRFSRNDWEQIVCAGAGQMLNGIAPFVDEVFWDALHRCWPTWFYDAQDENKVGSWPIWNDHLKVVHNERTCMNGRYFSSWSYLLFYHPEYASAGKEMNVWRSFNQDDWLRLLKGGKFLETVDRQVLDADFWIPLLVNAPQHGETCDAFNGWPTLSANDWYGLLNMHPQFASRCHCWAQFSCDQWVTLLGKDASFTAFCDQADGWSKFGKEVWLSLLLSNKSFAKKCEESGALAKFGWTSVDEAIANYKKNKHHQCDYQDGSLDSPDWREESGWNDMYGDADASDFIEFR